MRIKWYGTASLLIEGGNTRILVDPHLKQYNTALSPLPMEEAKTAQAIFITHPHFDHFADIGTFIDAGMKEIYVSENGITKAAKYGVPTDSMNPICANQRYVVGDITVRIFQSRHCKFDFGTVLGVLLKPSLYFKFGKTKQILKSIKQFKISDDIYALEFSADGKKVMTLGSAGMDENTEYPDNADLLVLPYQGRTHMHRYVTPIMKAFSPKAIMIDHFDNAYPPLTHAVNTKKFIPAAQKAVPNARAFIPTEGEWYEV